MKNKLCLIFISLLFLLPALAQESQRVQVIARIKLSSQEMELSEQGQTRHFPLRLQDKPLARALKELAPEDEVILEGQVVNESVPGSEGVEIRQVFIVEKLTPISLKRLGKMDDFKVEERPVTFRLEKTAYSPKKLSVGDGVVAGLTLTATILLLKSLAATPADPKTGDELTNALIFSAGALATGVEVVEDLQKVKRP